MKRFSIDPYEKLKEFIEKEGLCGREAVSVFTTLLIEACISTGTTRKEIADCLRACWPKD
jgi:hypothetical protein